MRIKITIEVTENGYETKVEQDDIRIYHLKGKYIGGGVIDYIDKEEDIEDSDLEDKIDDFEINATDIMYYLQQREEDEE